MPNTINGTIKLSGDPHSLKKLLRSLVKKEISQTNHEIKMNDFPSTSILYQVSEKDITENSVTFPIKQYSQFPKESFQNLAKKYNLNIEIKGIEIMNLFETIIVIDNKGTIIRDEELKIEVDKENQKLIYS